MDLTVRMLLIGLLFMVTLMLFLIDQRVLSGGFFLMSALMSLHTIYRASKREQTLKAAYQQGTRPLEIGVHTPIDFTVLSNLIGRAMLALDAHGVIRHVNADFNAMFGLDLVPDTPYEKLKRIKQLFQTIQSQYLNPERMRTQIIHDEHHFDMHITPFMDQEHFRGMLIIVHDINQLKTAETFQKQFTADVTHELKTPLTNVKGFSELIVRHPDMPKHERDDFLNIIHQETLHMENILNDLLIIAKMDRLDYELKIKNVDIKSLIQDAVHSLKREADQKGLLLKTDLDDGRLAIDETKMHQVIINLIKNALVYTDKGSIHVKGTANEDGYHIDVIDTGIGIPLEEQEKVFKRFHRLDEARSRASGGSGLGLSIVKNVVKKHGGSIGLVSEVNIGSHFKIFLPKENGKTLDDA